MVKVLQLIESRQCVRFQKIYENFLETFPGKSIPNIVIEGTPSDDYDEVNNMTKKVQGHSSVLSIIKIFNKSLTPIDTGLFEASDDQGGQSEPHLPILISGMIQSLFLAGGVYGMT